MYLKLINLRAGSEDQNVRDTIDPITSVFEI